tara:strand:- start:348 stop:575 length:228 start_codon:yes stop_codon:yes gene_type:complete
MDDGMVDACIGNSFLFCRDLSDVCESRTLSPTALASAFGRRWSCTLSPRTRDALPTLVRLSKPELTLRTSARMTL